MEAEIASAALAALEAGRLEVGARPSRRHRWQLLAWHVLDDEALVAAARRDKRARLTVMTHRFHRTGGRWTWDEAGPSSDFEGPIMEPRRSLPGATCTESSSWGAGGGSGTWWELWRLPSEAAFLREGDHVEVVPAHGWVPRVRRPPSDLRTDVLDVQGALIGRLGAHRSAQLPPSVRVRLQDLAAGTGDGWLNWAPDR
ncbi:hypothetical protein KSP35_05300 [Aquihabitans sp. G128]|uniref:hypothetical protein n=1 Tax=Aquihabitans sp. G128 TaxID=2849779 RepID=UPI001C211CFE|nr:hypothetical protein KSP35_05300 [Aquihabitans sp. G128]